MELGLWAPDCCSMWLITERSPCVLSTEHAGKCNMGSAVVHLWSLKARSRTWMMRSSGKSKYLQMALATSMTVRSFCVPMLYVSPTTPLCRIMSNASATSSTYRYDRVLCSRTQSVSEAFQTVAVLRSTTKRGTGFQAKDISHQDTALYSCRAGQWPLVGSWSLWNLQHLHSNLFLSACITACKHKSMHMLKNGRNDRPDRHHAREAARHAWPAG